MTSPYLCIFLKGQNLIKLNSDKYEVLYFRLKNQRHTSNTRKMWFNWSGTLNLLRANNSPHSERILVASATVGWWTQCCMTSSPPLMWIYSFYHQISGIYDLTSAHMQAKCFPRRALMWADALSQGQGRSISIFCVCLPVAGSKFNSQEFMPKGTMERGPI